MDVLQNADPDIWQAIQNERRRQQQGLEMIASENFTSRAVMEAQGSVLTNKYAEGLPGKRYYGGCEFVDVAENLALERVGRLFGAGHANVQAHSGAAANLAAYLAVAAPGDTLLGISLAHGGRLTHGHSVSFSGRRCRLALAHAELGQNLGRPVFPRRQGGRLMHMMAAKSGCFGEALTEGFESYRKRLFGHAAAHARELIARGFDVVSGGADN